MASLSARAKRAARMGKITLPFSLDANVEPWELHFFDETYRADVSWALKQYEANFGPRPTPDDEYVVKRIAGKRAIASRTEYLVVWEGHTKPTWEPEDCLFYCPDLIFEYMRMINNPTVYADMIY